ncbi:hypothetical protein A4249_07480 [Brevundimonas sp. GW460-12-10-14-LB2]|jgi:hypothetical protein|uniref:tail fiber domain-containing protein n=1 Tax=Brevundimonas TaxID=41275 RepID=UPI0007BC91FC|nr:MULTISPECIES: tail fiber domain-containing protein [Brevundimonas]ANC53514.1 hypothetical protein A4249_07480 [Brevundimonas sp. GW460-12-10-14-LB2]
MSGLTITTLAQQIEDLIGKSEQQTKAVTAWLGGSADGGPNNDGRYPFVDLGGREILVPSPASFSDMTSGPAAQASVAKVAAELARDLAKGHADRSDAQRILSEAARGAAVDARNLAQEHRNHAGNHEANARYWAELAQGSGQSTSEDREIVEQLAEEVADNAALVAQDALDAAASAALAATFDPNLFDKKSDTLASSRLEGMIDPARIPVLVGQTPVVSTGGITNLTTVQQNGIRPGTLVATMDGRRWVYSGSGAKNVEANYIEQGDVTPVWSVIADKPSFFPSNIVNVAGLQSALDGKSNVGHGHVIADVANLQAALDARSLTGHVHAWTTITDRPTIFPSDIANVSGLQAALDGRAAAGHVHAWDTITGKPSTYPATAHLHNITDVNGLLDALNGKIASGSAATVTNLKFNTGLLYPDGNHSVLKTGAAGSERYWRFDQNGWFYGLSGGLYIATNAHIAGDQLRVGPADSGSRTDVNRGWVELRNDSNGYGPYIDLSADSTTDYHARLAWAGGRFDLQSTTSLHLTARGTNNHVRAYSETGKQNGDVLTEGGAEQTLSKQLTFSSTQNPQDAAAFATLEVRGSGGGYGAWMKFHRPGAYGTYFGMFEDGKWGFGGWSTGATIYEFWTSKNLDANGLMRRYCDGWNTTTDGNERFYFASNGRSYYRSRGGHEFRNADDQRVVSIDNGGFLEATSGLSTLGNYLKIRGGSPTIYFKDTDSRSAMIHVNSNVMHFLRGSGNDSEAWETVNGRWPLTINLENNEATMGGSINAENGNVYTQSFYATSQVYSGFGHWFRVRGTGSGIYWEQHGGGFHMSDNDWVRVYNGKNFYCSAQVRANTVVGESDRRLKTNIAPITDAMSKVRALEGVTFDWIASGMASLGFIAQDLETVLPTLVTEDADGIKGVQYGPVVALLVEALKDADARIGRLEGRV